MRYFFMITFKWEIMKKYRIGLLFSLAFFAFFSCASYFSTLRDSLKGQINSEVRETILRQADELLGKKTYSKVFVNGKSFTLDCIGTIGAIYYSAGIDIRKYFGKYNGGGVERFYRTLKDNKSLFNDRRPEPGDVIFWDNTWDANENGKNGDDRLTHVGMVISVDDDGTINFIHANYVLGIVIEQMNLQKPAVYRDKNGKIINTPMYLNSSLKSHPEHWLSGDLFNRYGSVLRIKDIF